MGKKFVGIPDNRLERILMSAKMAETLSGEKTSKKEVIELINANNLILTDEEKVEIDELFL